MLEKRRIGTNIKLCHIQQQWTINNHLRGEGGSKVGSQSFLYFTVFKIWNTGVQELFTELKNIDFRARTVPLNWERTAKCREMYRISHIIKNGLKISFGTRFLGVGASD